VFLPGDPETVLSDLTRAVGADLVAWNALCEPHNRALDDRVEASLARAGVDTQTFSASLLFEPEDHLSRAGKRFVQFGAFWRSCLSQPAPRAPLAAPLYLPAVPAADDILLGSVDPAQGLAPHGVRLQVGAPMPDLSSVWQPGKEGAQRRLARFVEEALADYPAARDYPAVEGVSRLSPHLHFGEISPHQVWHAVGEAAGAPEGSDAFLRQLGWREFGHYLLYHFPTIATEPFRPEFSRFPWHDDPEGLATWQEGATGFPLVDAGMRQLREEGWMHNRVRMVVASFLTKDLLIPWQKGAAWFWDCLVDADLANNTLGWQWTAGSGPDAAPYFRVFNPDLQARRFDPAGEYMERWLPAGVRDGRAPIVDHALARLRALEAFRRVRTR
jgi:deoxyribodipyrimidine photo-lyase